MLFTPHRHSFVYRCSSSLLLLVGASLFAACNAPVSIQLDDLENESVNRGANDEADTSEDKGSSMLELGDDLVADAPSEEELDPCEGPMPPASCTNLEYEPTGPGCGDAIINVEGEECDDGNGLPGDGCSGTCKVEPNYSCDETGCSSQIQCGDGETQVGEVCDDGNTEAGDGCGSGCLLIESGFSCPPLGGDCEEIDLCLSTSPPAECFPPPGSNPHCGDGEQNLAWEECDDNNNLPGDGCSGVCKAEANWDCSGASCVSLIVCGNGQVDPGEVCDDGDTLGNNGCEADCLSLTAGFSCPLTGGTCTAVDPCDLPRPPAECFSDSDPSDPDPFCGDGENNQTSEECDDGGTQPGDGCSGACKVEPNYNCDASGCTSTIECGDGVRQGDEICDDNNLTSGDGCSDACSVIDPFYVCPPAGGACTSTIVCNDGRITGDEECEDGNQTNLDGCSSNCQLEDGYFCPTIGASCQPVPFCGDGSLTAGEECDDANNAAPGCDSECKIEDGYGCPTAGQACVSTDTVCGDGTISGAEECDDRNSAAPGCDAECKIETGYSCPEGEDCFAICGDGILVEGEICDDGTPPEDRDPGVVYELAQQDGDGCSSACNWEPGFYCEETIPHACVADICGNGEVGNDEACDLGPGLNVPGSGCAPDCSAEPTCAYGSSGCSSICGDGLLIGAEECDDGNARDGDGCDSSCQIEYGFTCNQPTACDEKRSWNADNDNTTDPHETCVSVIPVVYRDFNAAHPHFEPSGNSTGTPGMLQTSLQADGTPALVVSGPGYSELSTPSRFDEWYSDSTASETVFGELVLWDRDRDIDVADSAYDPDVGTITFVNRYAADGVQFGDVSGRVADPDAGTPPTSGDYCSEPCWVNGGPSGGAYVEGSIVQNKGGIYRCNGWPQTPRCNDPAAWAWEPGVGTAWTDPWSAESFTCTPDPACGTPGGGGGGGGGGQYWDGSPAFFPLDGLGKTPTSQYFQAEIPTFYGGVSNAPGGTRNFHFTTEVRQWFKFDDEKEYQLTFNGDDDFWVFINGVLALDLGGRHENQVGTITIPGDGTILSKAHTRPQESSTLASFNLVDGNVYEIAIFHAERQTTASTFALSLSGFNRNPSVCESVCGDGELAAGEQCETTAPDGVADCSDECRFTSFCGDGIKNGSEACDNGVNLSGWNDTSEDACAPGCKLPSVCGDGSVDPLNEVCDDGDDNDAVGYAGCTTSCQLGPYCGDGVEQSGEDCDDGVNDGTAGCGPDCTSTVSCGNGQIDSGEECDDGVNDGAYGGCKSNCTLAAYCGDGVKNGAEECDDTTNNGSYGACAPGCFLGPRCGDGIVDATEDCDDRVNNGGYGECAPGCNTGDYCGDGERNGPEECDGEASCTGTCQYGPYCGDGAIDDGETCDDGDNLGGYGKCGPSCLPGPYCGDSVPHPANGEKCDDGVNDGGYGECAANCQLGPYCGDGIINGAETCDDGINDNGYGNCTSDCQTGAYCGDGIWQQDSEACDDGVNDGVESSCQPGCVLGPGCGDGVLQSGEQCDFGPGNSTGYNSCLPNTCVFGPRCGDGVVQGDYELCDGGDNPGGYGECAQNCRFGPYCGDGVVNGNEICDDGVNDGGYGECAAACKLGPYCGDGELEEGRETCDDGNRNNNDGCSATCQSEAILK